MRRFLHFFITVAFVVGTYAQNEVHIVQKTRTTVLNLADVKSIDVGDYSPWTKFGTGTYTLSIYWGGTHSELPIYYREYLLNDVDAQFYIPGIANSMDLTIEYNKQTGACQIFPQYATTNSNYGQVTITDIYHYPFANIDPKDYETYPCTFDKETGLFTFNVAYIVCTLYNANTNGSFGNGVETFQLDMSNMPAVPDVSLVKRVRERGGDFASDSFAAIEEVKNSALKRNSVVKSNNHFIPVALKKVKMTEADYNQKAVPGK